MKEETKWRCLQDLTMANHDVVFIKGKEYLQIMFAEEFELINEEGEDHEITLWKEHFEKVESKPITFEDLEEGQHLWVIYENHLILVVKSCEFGYSCQQSWDPWDVPKDEVTIIELVDKPKGHETTPMYYF